MSRRLYRDFRRHHRHTYDSGGLSPMRMSTARPRAQYGLCKGLFYLPPQAVVREYFLAQLHELQAAHLLGQTGGVRAI